MNEYFNLNIGVRLLVCNTILVCMFSCNSNSKDLEKLDYIFYKGDTVEIQKHEIPLYNLVYNYLENDNNKGILDTSHVLVIAMMDSISFMNGNLRFYYFNYESMQEIVPGGGKAICGYTIILIRDALTNNNYVHIRDFDEIGPVLQVKEGILVKPNYFSNEIDKFQFKYQIDAMKLESVINNLPYIVRNSLTNQLLDSLFTYYLFEISDRTALTEEGNDKYILHINQLNELLDKEINNIKNTYPTKEDFMKFKKFANQQGKNQDVHFYYAGFHYWIVTINEELNKDSAVFEDKHKYFYRSYRSIENELFRIKIYRLPIGRVY